MLLLLGVVAYLTVGRFYSLMTLEFSRLRILSKYYDDEQLHTMYSGSYDHWEEVREQKRSLRLFVRDSSFFRAFLFPIAMVKDVLAIPEAYRTHKKLKEYAANE